MTQTEPTRSNYWIYVRITGKEMLLSVRSRGKDDRSLEM